MRTQHTCTASASCYYYALRRMTWHNCCMHNALLCNQSTTAQLYTSKHSAEIYSIDNLKLCSTYTQAVVTMHSSIACGNCCRIALHNMVVTAQRKGFRVWGLGYTVHHQCSIILCTMLCSHGIAQALTHTRAAYDCKLVCNH